MVYIKDNPINNFINYFFSLNPYELTLIGNILGIIIAKPLTLNQQNTLGNFLELIGQQILTIQAQGSNLAPNFINTIDFNHLLNELNFKFEYLEELIAYLKTKRNKN